MFNSHKIKTETYKTRTIYDGTCAFKDDVPEEIDRYGGRSSSAENEGNYMVEWFIVYCFGLLGSFTSFAFGILGAFKNSHLPGNWRSPLYVFMKIAIVFCAAAVPVLHEIPQHNHLLAVELGLGGEWILRKLADVVKDKA